MNKVIALLKHEPVAVWGAVISAVLGVPALAGVPAWVITVAVAVLTALGVPVVRSQVTPTSSGTLGPAGTPVDKQAGYGLVEIAVFLLILAIALVVLNRNGLL